MIQFKVKRYFNTIFIKELNHSDIRDLHKWVNHYLFKGNHASTRYLYKSILFFEKYMPKTFLLGLNRNGDIFGI